MNNITELQARLVAKDAEIRALRDGIQHMIDYLHTPKFNHGDRLDGYVNVVDVVEGLRQSASNSYDVAYAAYRNEVGPSIADGSHTGCSHGTAAGVPRVNGYHCPECGTALPPHELLARHRGAWNDTDARAAERMRKHWVECHRRKE